jgi:hypothetical protein
LAEILAVLSLFPRRRDDADFLNPRVDGFLGDDLDDRLGQAVPVHEGEEFFLDGAGGRVLAGPAARGRDDGFGHLSHGIRIGVSFEITTEHTAQAACPCPRSCGCGV